MRAVNLLPRDDARAARSRDRDRKIVAAFAVMCVVAVGLGGATMFASAGLQDRRDELAALEAELAVVPQPPPAPTALEAQFSDERTRRTAAFSTAFTERIAWDHLLRRFALVLPDDVWLTSFLVKTPAEPPAAVPTDLEISGYTYSHDGVARLLGRLAVIPDLDTVQLQNSTLSNLGGRSVVQFRLVAAVRRQGVAS